MPDNKAPDIDELMNTLFKGGTLRTGTGRPAGAKPKEDIVLTTTPNTPYATGATRPAAAKNLDTDTLMRMNDEIMNEINKMNQQLQKDELVSSSEIAQPLPKLPEGAPPADIDAAFAAVKERMLQRIAGQDAFVNQLVIAFKRPYVMGTEEGKAKNSIVVRGHKGTGKHTAVTAIAEELHTQGLTTAPGIDYIDLSLYPSAEESKLFLQDLYRALETPESVIVFDNYSACHSSLLAMVGSLVQHGRLPLSSRYVMQKGMLVEAGTALTPNAISALTLSGQYLVFINENKVAKLAEAFGAPFINALGDICETGSFDDESLLQIAQRQLASFTEKAKTNLGYTLEIAPEVTEHVAQRHNTEVGVSAIAAYLNRCYHALAEYKLQGGAAGGQVITLSVAEGNSLDANFGEGPTPLLGLLPSGYTGELDSVKAEMDKIVGLAEIKRYILSLEQNIQVQTMRKAQGMRTSSPSMHMIFTGNPGTGKTTIARLTAKYFKAIGVLSGGQLIEVSRADLVGRYVGHTAPLTNQVIKSAIGGVLFIDEAYSLFRGRDDSFGLEAIDTLVKGMEDNRNDLVVILAGYSKEMAEFLTSNSGLKSRFPNIVEFPDYTGEELLAISKITAEGQGYRMDSGCDKPLLKYFEKVQRQNAREAGNGRLSRNKVEEAILNQSRRILAEGKGELDLLIAGDFDLN